MRLEGLSELKIPVSPIGNRTRDLLACGAVPQPTAPSCRDLTVATTLYSLGTNVSRFRATKDELSRSQSMYLKCEI